MTNQIAVALILLIIALFALDYFVLHMDLHIQVARGFDDFIEYLAFWR